MKTMNFLDESHPYLLHTGYYSKLSRAVFNLLIDLGSIGSNPQNHYLRLLSTDGTPLSGQGQCCCVFYRYIEEFVLMRALDNEILLRKAYCDTAFDSEYIFKYLRDCRLNIGVLIKEFSRFVKDEDQPFLVVPDRGVEKLKDSFREAFSIYESPSLEEAAEKEFFTIRKLRELQKGTEEGKCDQFQIEAKRLLKARLIESMNAVENLMHDLVEKAKIMNSFDIRAFVQLYPTDNFEKRAIEERRFDSFGDVFRERTKVWFTDWLKDLPTIARMECIISKVEKSDEMKEMLDIMKELNKLTPLRILIDEITKFEE